ncbi:MAG: competence protein CoiA family protein [Mycobacteriales bacterium]
MPLTAQHPELGLLDSSTEELRHGEGAWPRVYKVRPRAPLTCRGCGHGLHAKVSSNGLRFFSHDAAQSDCPTAGESLAHRLLKLELVSAVRAAGWEAELEVAGNGWRADVLATSPEGRQVAWEAQLAQITPQEIVNRHSTMTADGLEVCWVADRPRAWIGQVPAIAVAPAHPETVRSDLQVVAGHARFEPSWCENRRSCGHVLDFGGYARPAAPCPGHGRWETPPPLPLTSFVAAVCADSLRCLTLAEHHRDARQRHGAPAAAWTARRYSVAEQAQVAARKVREAFEQRLDAEEASHQRRIVALMDRQQAIRKPAAARVGELTGTQAWANDDAQGPGWAMGIPVEAGSQGVAGVICPVASRIKGSVRSRLAPLLILVASQDEAGRIAETAEPGQRIEVLASEAPPPPPIRSPRQDGDLTLHSITRRMLGM